MKKELSQVIDLLNIELPKIDRKYEDINFGGCGMFAAFLTQSLLKLGIKSKTIYLAPSSCPKPIYKGVYNTIKSVDCLRLNDFNTMGFYCYHLMVCLKYNKTNYYIDSTGVWKDEVPEEYLHCTKVLKLSPEQIIQIDKYTTAWNPQFNRNQIPSIKKDIKKVFEKFA